jgi:GntR family transcriptional regulator
MEFRKHRSIYMQIADYFYEQILKGDWPPGEKVPSVRQLAVELEVNPNTVMRTYTILQEQEILSNQRGIGFFVTQEAPGLVKGRIRKRFLAEQLPEVFETMNLLGMSIRDLASAYEQDQRKNRKE